MIRKIKELFNDFSIRLYFLGLNIDAIGTYLHAKYIDLQRFMLYEGNVIIREASEKLGAEAALLVYLISPKVTYILYRLVKKWGYDNKSILRGIGFVHMAGGMSWWFRDYTYIPIAVGAADVFISNIVKAVNLDKILSDYEIKKKRSKK